jgi:hypothetical protein
LEQILTDLATFDPSPFDDSSKTDPSSGDRPDVDVSPAAMTRLRTPFGVESDAERPQTPRP